MTFGYDWKGSSTKDPRDANVDWDNGEEVARSFWFKGYRERVKGQVLVLAQDIHIDKIVLMCIDGGPITQLEQRTMCQVGPERPDAATHGSGCIHTHKIP